MNSKKAVARAPALLMSRPDHFRVAYEINPWMRISHQPDFKKSVGQWRTLYNTLKDKVGARIFLVPPMKDCPDLVFTANAGFVYEKKVILSRFRHAERRREEPHYSTYLRKLGYKVIQVKDHRFFEGEGDLLYQSGFLFMGYRFRSEWEAHRSISETLRLPVIPLELVEEHFYHLDTCFLPLNKDILLYYPEAFSIQARMLIRSLVPNPVPVTRAEALKFVLNGVVINGFLVTNKGFSPETKQLIRTIGLKLIELDLSEFHKSGGSAKCLTLYLPARYV